MCLRRRQAPARKCPLRVPQANRGVRRLDDLPTTPPKCPLHREENNGVAGMTPSDEPPTDLTALMSLDPLDLTKQDLDKIIAYQRKQRLAREGGAKTKRATNDAPAVDIMALLGRIQKGPEPVIVKAAPVKATPTAPSK